MRRRLQLVLRPSIDRSETRNDRAETCLARQHAQPVSKIILSPVAPVYKAL